MIRSLFTLLLVAAPLTADDAVDRLAADALKAWKAPGLAVAIVQDGRTVALKAYGVRDASKPDALTVDDAFPLASCTKAFTSALIAHLVDEGKMSWDEPARTHLPVFKLSDPNADALVSLRDMLSHRTGVNGHDLLWYRAPWSKEEAIKRIQHLPLNEPFRGAYQYSTIMVMAAGQSAANAAGTNWDSALQKRVLEPLGMTSVTFATNEKQFLQQSKAIGHRIANDKLETMPLYEVPEPNPAGSINLSIRDMAPWMQLHLHGGEWNGKRIVSAANLAVTHAPQIVIPMDASMKRFHPDTVQLSYGMGWIIGDYRGVKVLSHGGMIDGFRTQVILVPEKKLGIALFNNLHDTKLNAALGNALVDHFLNLPARDWNAILQQAVADEKAGRDAEWAKVVAARKNLPRIGLPIDKFPGEYENDAYGVAKLSMKDGKLLFEWSGFKSPLEYWGEFTFRITEGFLDNSFLDVKATPNGLELFRFQGMIFTRKK